MNIIFKFWLWRITFKANRLDADKKIEFLTNELIKAWANSGRTVLDEGHHGSMWIFLWRIGETDALIRLSSGNQEIEFKPTFKTL